MGPEREAIPRLPGRYRRLLARTLAPGSRGCHRVASPDAAPHLQPLRYRAQRSGRTDPRSVVGRRWSSVLRELRGRGERVCPEARPKMGWVPEVRGRERVRLVPWSDACDAACDRPTTEARGLPTTSRGLPPCRLGRPRRARGSHRPNCRGRPAGAGAGRGWGESGHRGVLRGGAPAV